jgi:cysteinyl-tRNA synthetase
MPYPKLKKKYIDMKLRVFNSLTKKKEAFEPAEAGIVRLYTCGPTVYNYAHIGNFRTFLFGDLLKRWLQHKGYKVIKVMNITDVDEKTIEWSRRRKIPWKRLAKKYERAFFEDLITLNIEAADHYPRTSDHINEIQILTMKLLKKGYAFKDETGNVFLNVHKVDYGRLSGLKPKSKLRAKIKREDYKDPKHFVLWKIWDNHDADMCWESETGKGRPGWHVECAALELNYLGEKVDIHCGGIDLIFPHHENSLAVCEAATEKIPTGYWLHVKHLISDGKKMSKSLGNFYTLRDLIKKGYNPLAIRLLLLSTYYRNSLDFTIDSLKMTEKKLDYLKFFLERLDEVNGEGSTEYSSLIKDVKRQVWSALDNDLNSSIALTAIFKFVKNVEKKIEIHGITKDESKKIKNVLMDFNSIFGFIGEYDDN